MKVMTPDELDFMKRQAQAILDNEAWKLVKSSLAYRYQQAWLYGKTVEVRETMWAKTSALADLVNEIDVILNAGPLPYPEPEPPTPTQDGA